MKFGGGFEMCHVCVQRGGGEVYDVDSMEKEESNFPRLSFFLSLFPPLVPNVRPIPLGFI